MNILGIGVDFIEVERIAASLQRHGDVFLRRVFTAAEVTTCGGRAERLAARFAAKEAVAKAFGTGLGAACEADDIRHRVYEANGIVETIRVVVFDDADSKYISPKLKRYHRFHADRDFDAFESHRGLRVWKH